MRMTASWLGAGLILALLVGAGRPDEKPKGEPAKAEPTKAENKGTEWTDWRGPLHNGVSYETNLPDKFNPNNDDNVAWKADQGSRCNPVVHNGRIFMIGGTGSGMNEQERVFALDAHTGKQLWEYKFNVFLTDIVSDRLGWSNVACDPETGCVYVQGTQGLLLCLEPEKGKVVWQKSLTEEFGRISGYGGRITSPIIDEDKVIIGIICASWGELARGGNRLLAMDKKTGDIVWWANTGGQTKNTYFSTPVVGVINNQRVIVTGGADGGVHAFKVRTGEKLWSYFYCAGSINCSPVLDGNRVYIAHGDENLDSAKQGRIICLDAGEVKEGKPKLVWQVDGPKIKFASPILHEGKLYVADDAANLYCYDAKEGKQHWRYKYGRNGMGSPILADGKIYIAEVNNKFLVLKDAGTKCEKLHEQKFVSQVPGVEVELNGSPAVAYGRVYFSTSQATYAVGKSDWKPGAVKLPEQPKEPETKGKATLLQVVPADVNRMGGEKASFKARLFDENGRFIKETAAEWSADAMLPPPPLPGQPAQPGAAPPVIKGELTKDGSFTPDKAMNGQVGRVIAKAEGLEGYARVRQPVVLPYKQDFEKVPENRSPGGWVNTQGKFSVRNAKDLKNFKNAGAGNVLVKLANNPSPLVARANAFLGLPTLTDYQIEADVAADKLGEDQADVGIVNQRYTFFLDGNKQQLRLISWDALPRVDKTIVFKWEANTWYHMKLVVDQQGEKALVRGKIWEHGKEEPKAWTLEVTDTSPNFSGAPALYANAVGFVGTNPGAEAYFDNVMVTPNKK